MDRQSLASAESEASIPQPAPQFEGARKCHPAASPFEVFETDVAGQKALARLEPGKVPRSEQHGAIAQAQRSRRVEPLRLFQILKQIAPGMSFVGRLVEGIFRDQPRSVLVQACR